LPDNKAILGFMRYCAKLVPKLQADQAFFVGQGGKDDILPHCEPYHHWVSHQTIWAAINRVVGLSAAFS
jgi:hypothetical protein